MISLRISNSPKHDNYFYLLSAARQDNAHLCFLYETTINCKWGKINLIMNKPLAKLGKHIKKIRKIKGITLEKLAYENDLSKGNLSKIEKGLVDPQFLTLFKIANGLGLSLKELLDF
jgi:DNA-binding XRE family transcriptional regulator